MHWKEEEDQMLPLCNNAERWKRWSDEEQVQLYVCSRFYGCGTESNR